MGVLKVISKAILKTVGLLLLLLGYMLGVIAKLGGTLLYIVSGLMLLATVWLSFSGDITVSSKLLYWGATFLVGVISLFISQLPDLLFLSGNYLMDLIE